MARKIPVCGSSLDKGGSVCDKIEMITTKHWMELTACVTGTLVKYFDMQIQFDVYNKPLR